MVDEKSVEKKELGLTAKQWELMGEVTPAKYIKKRPGRGGMTFDYVEVGYMQDLLNKTFGGMWNFEIISEVVGNAQVYVKGRLTCMIRTEFGVEKIVKENYGGSDLKKNQSGVTIDIADDLKSASSDCLKKCASMLGFAKDIYWRL